MDLADARQGRPRASEFVFARLRYDSGDWDYNPKVAANVLNSVVEYTNIRVYPDEVVIGASSAELMAFLSEGFPERSKYFVKSSTASARSPRAARDSARL